ncbi:phosphotransferase [Frankia sp. CNm7]|uniref:Phosphotransferase n=1 Tax=Frankia nepalensis TaxID=1836974 RepID=A0A937UPQ8_9ACTN|nr:phosphotransferase [Frankia nepalensis]MBL7498021.1 phosphotransferase [Frankia nepalensis]MBL7516125.1 phosphotransferase [Frankia nepalensis]MBL7521966.1 phosphotransferase [Frankia nepalensis]MBL7629323.1 phosphotransferase [Frankia nepalensis]
MRDHDGPLPLPDQVVLGEAPVVDDPADVTPAWLTEALRAGGTDVVVSELRYERIGTGLLGASYRFHLVAHAGPGAVAPASVVVKMAAGSEQAREVVKLGYQTEIGFYRTFAAQTRIRRPRCWSAGISADLRDFTLVLEDAHPALPGRQTDGCTAGQAAAAVRNLAGLHAPFWNRHDLADGVDWLRGPDDARLEFLAQVHAQGTSAFVERFGAALSPEDADTLRRASDLLAGWAPHVRDRVSLIHGDYRLDNLLFAGDDPTVVDWQSLELGLPGRDLAYFLATALPPAARRAHERSLVAAYHRRLTELGVDDYPLELCFHDYRVGVPQAPLLIVLGCVYAPGGQSADSDAMFLSMAANACAAIRDLGTLDLLSATP